jgi:hypothetical protein
MGKGSLITGFMFLAVTAFSQDFERSATGFSDDKKPKVRVGADFAMQYQGLEHHADSNLIPLGKGINLPTANLNLDAVLADGIELNLVTYLSSRHHVEAWVKGGYLLIDKLPFINSGLVDNVMEYMTFKVGVMEINYGDAHFRRSDNGKVLTNRFVGNNIIDGFTTSPAFEALYRNNGMLLMGAVSTGSLKPALSGYNASSGTYKAYDMGEELAFYWKAGYDKNLNEDLRLRATISGYHAANHHFGSLYDGDRAGSRFYLIMNRVTNSANDVDPAMNHLSGNWGPGFTDKNNSIMLNLFTRYKGLEFFGTYESVKGTNAFGGAEFNFSQFALEGLYFFGREEQFYGGIRYNHASNDTDDSVNRTEVSAGWFLTPEILVKLEYADQNYKNFVMYGATAGFDGLMIEAAISF